jgi:hypothetical protein
MKTSRNENIGVLALDMIVQESDLYRIISAITMPSTMVAPIRTYCMNCKGMTGTTTTTTTRHHPSLPKLTMIHCRHCSRSVCTNCCKVRLPVDYFGKNFRIDPLRNGMTAPPLPLLLWPCCVICEKILTSRREMMSQSTQPTTTTSYGSNGGITEFLFDSYDNDETDRYSC